MSRNSYVSTNCFRDRSPEGVVVAIREGGWTQVEFSALRASAPEAVALCRRLRAEGIEIVLHNYFPPPDEPFVMNLASLDRDLLARSRRHCEEAILLSAELGAPFFAAHAGFVADLPPALLGDPAGQREFCREARELPSAAEANRIFTESVASLVEFAKEQGLRFLIENHVAGEALGAEAGRSLLLCLEAEDFTALATDVGEDFGMLLDVGHLRCTASVLGFSMKEFCRELSRHVRAFHLSDNNGRSDQHRPFDAHAWFLEIVASLPQATVTLEFDRCSDSELKTSMEIVRNL